MPNCLDTRKKAYHAMLLMRSYFVSVRVVCACDASRYGFSIRNIIIARWSTHRLCVAKNEIDSLARILYQLKFIRFGILFIVFVSNFFVSFCLHSSPQYTRIHCTHEFFFILIIFFAISFDSFLWHEYWHCLQFVYSFATLESRRFFLLSISWFSFLFIYEIYLLIMKICT